MRNDVDQKTVCMYTPSSSGGHPLYTAELLTALATQPRQAFRYELVSSEDLCEPFRTGRRYAVHAVLPALRHRQSYPNQLAWACARLAHYARRELQFLAWLRRRPDVCCVHLQEWQRWLAAPLVRSIQRMGKPVCYTVHNVYPHKYPSRLPKWLVDRTRRAAMRRCDALFVLTERLADELRHYLGDRHPPIFVAPHGVWTVPDADQPPPPSIEQRLASKRLLFFGSIRENKGLHILLRAAEQLPGYSITIAGEPWEPGYVRQQILPQIARLRELGRTVTLVDRFIEDKEVGPLFKSHSAIVLPYTNGFVAQSGVVYMALAYGLPVVASEAGGLRDLLRDAGVGVTFEQPTPDALAAAVRSLEAESAQQGLAQGLARAKDRYSWAVTARATVAAYSTICEGRRLAHGDDNVHPVSAH